MAASASRGRSSGRSGRSAGGSGSRSRSGSTGRSSRAKASGGRSGQGRSSGRGRSAGGDDEREQRGRSQGARAKSSRARGGRAQGGRSQSSRAQGSRSQSSRSQGSRAQGTRSRAGASRGAQGTRSGQGSRARSSRSTAARTSRTSRSPRTSRRGQLDPVAMLREDHRRVAQLFEQFEKTKAANRKKSLFEQIRNELELHARLEEDLFYPEAEERQELKGQVKEAHGEHDKVKQMLREAEGLDPDSGEFDATVAGLKGAVEHHVQEEEGEMFPVIEKSFSQEHMQELAQKMKERRAELQRGNGLMGEGKSLVGRLMGR